MRKSQLVFVAGALALTIGVSTGAAADGSSDNAERCQNGGWAELERSDGTAFRNAGECISYAARGGVLMPTFAQSRLACEEIGGTFGVGGDVPGLEPGSVLWTCNGWSFTQEKLVVIDARCLADGGRVRQRTNDVLTNFACAV